MANPSSNNRNAAQPARVPAERAQGLDPEITAQPRPPSEDFAPDDEAEIGLSVDPDELGTRFLIQAVEQGPEPMRSALDVELDVSGPAPSDEPLASPNFEPNHSVWEQTVERAYQTRGAIDQLRASPQLIDDDLDEVAETENPEREAVQATQASHPQGSLLDYESDPDDETRTPEIQTEDVGQHSRTTPRGELGAQVDPPLHQSGIRSVAQPVSAAKSGKGSSAPQATEPSSRRPTAPKQTPASDAEQRNGAQPTPTGERGERTRGGFLRRVVLNSAATLKVLARRIRPDGADRPRRAKVDRAS